MFEAFKRYNYNIKFVVINLIILRIDMKITQFIDNLNRWDFTESAENPDYMGDMDTQEGDCKVKT